MIKKVWTPQTQRNPHSWQQFQPKSSGKAAATAVPAAIPATLREGKAGVRPSITSCLGEEAQLALFTTVKPAMQSAVVVTEETSQGNNTKINPQTQEKMHFVHPPFSMEMVLVIVIAGGGKLLLGRNTVSQRSLSACNEIGRKQPGLEHKAKASEKLPSTQHREKKRPQWTDQWSEIHPKDALPRQTALARSFCTSFQMVRLFSPSFILSRQPEAQQDRIIALF